MEPFDPRLHLPEMHQDEYGDLESFHHLRAVITTVQSILVAPDAQIILPEPHQNAEARGILRASMPELLKIAETTPRRPEQVTPQRVRKLLDHMLHIMFFHDLYTYRHSHATSRYASMIAELAGITDPSLDIEGVRLAGLMHDIGKLSIPGHILNKPDLLLPNEVDINHEHPGEGGKLIQTLIWVCEDVVGSRSTPITDKTLLLLENVRKGIRYHHEFYNEPKRDGGLPIGYPEHLHGDEIPEVARIIKAADVIEAIRSDRGYRQNRASDGHNFRGLEVVVSEFIDRSGDMFDPRVAEGVVALFSTQDPRARADLDNVMYHFHPDLLIPRPADMFPENL